MIPTEYAIVAFCAGWLACALAEWILRFMEERGKFDK